MRKTPNAELNRLSVDGFKQAAKTPLVLVLDNVRSLSNIGSIFRTADAFLLEGIYLCGITPTPPRKEIRKTALGATKSVDWQHFQETATVIQQLKDNDYQIIAIEQADESVSLENFVVEKGKKYALVFGHEVNGVSQQVVNLSDTCLEIPQFGTKHSLNVSVSVGVVVWDFFKQLR